MLNKSYETLSFGAKCWIQTVECLAEICIEFLQSYPTNLTHIFLYSCRAEAGRGKVGHFQRVGRGLRHGRLGCRQVSSVDARGRHVQHQTQLPPQLCSLGIGHSAVQGGRERTQGRRLTPPGRRSRLQVCMSTHSIRLFLSINIS